MARILAVDDEGPMLGVLKLMLSSDGHDVVTADCGEKAAALIGADKFDMVISDIRMAPMDGLQLLKFAGEQCPGMPVMMITAFSSDRIVAEAEQLGAAAFIAKPFDPVKLLTTVTEVLGSAADGCAVGMIRLLG